MSGCARDTCQPDQRVFPNQLPRLIIRLMMLKMMAMMIKIEEFLRNSKNSREPIIIMMMMMMMTMTKSLFLILMLVTLCEPLSKYDWFLAPLTFVKVIQSQKISQSVSACPVTGFNLSCSPIHLRHWPMCNVQDQILLDLMINIDQFQPKPLSSDRKPSSACFKTWPKKSLFVFAAWIDFGSVLRQATTLRGASALTEIEHRELRWLFAKTRN